MVGLIHQSGGARHRSLLQERSRKRCSQGETSIGNRGSGDGPATGAFPAHPTAGRLWAPRTGQVAIILTLALPISFGRFCA
jgi:hypothetical protein